MKRLEQVGRDDTTPRRGRARSYDGPSGAHLSTPWHATDSVRSQHALSPGTLPSPSGPSYDSLAPERSIAGLTSRLAIPPMAWPISAHDAREEFFASRWEDPERARLRSSGSGAWSSR